MALQESLAVLAPVYSNLESEEEFERMQTILDSVVQLRDNSSVKQILIKYILSCFPMHHVPSRYTYFVTFTSRSSRGMDTLQVLSSGRLLEIRTANQ